jgi:hypothetical protein
MQDVIIVACVLSVVLAASFLVTWLFYRKREIKEILNKGADNSIDVIYLLILVILVFLFYKF